MFNFVWDKQRGEDEDYTQDELKRIKTTLETSGEELLHVSGNSSDDFLLPLYWVNQRNEAKPFQRRALAKLQSLPQKVNIVFYVLLATGSILCLFGLVLIIRMIKRSELFL